MLTGCTRYRTNWRKQLVMQVEFLVWSRRGGWSPGGFQRVWRDATVQDMQAIEHGEIRADRSEGLGPPPGRGSNPPPTYPRPEPPPAPPPLHSETRMEITFKYAVDAKVTTPFGEPAIVQMCAVDELGIQYYVKTAGGGNWFKEAELESA